MTCVGDRLLGEREGEREGERGRGGGGERGREKEGGGVRRCCTLAKDSWENENTTVQNPWKE